MHEPRRVGPYSLLRPLGKGGMGEVFEALGPGGRRVALKLLSRSGNTVAVDRFLREAELLARVRHPNVVVVHELGQDPAGPFLVTELVAGESLEAAVAAGRSLPLEAAATVLELCHAVSALHQVGVLHRDLKPENVMLRPDGRPVLLDFGLAREIGGSALTQTGQMLGTPAYLSPEQARGVSPTSLDARVDVYGLGAVLYFCLTGVPPHPECDTLPQLIGAIIHGEVVPPSERAPGVPPGLDAVCARALAKDPDERYPSADALGGDLERVLAGAQPLAAGRLPRHLALLAALTACAALVVTAAAGLVLLRARRRAAPPSSPPTASLSPAPTASGAPGRATVAPSPPSLSGRSSLESYELLRAWLREHPAARAAADVAARMETLTARPLVSLPAPPDGPAALPSAVLLPERVLALGTRDGLSLYALDAPSRRPRGISLPGDPPQGRLTTAVGLGEGALAVRGDGGVYLLTRAALAADPVRCSSPFATGSAAGPLAAAADGSWLALGVGNEVLIHGRGGGAAPARIALASKLDLLAAAGPLLVVVTELGRDQLSISTWDPAAPAAPLCRVDCYGSSAVISGSPAGDHLVAGTSAGQLHWIETSGRAPLESLAGVDVPQAGFISGAIAHRGGVKGVGFLAPDRFCTVAPIQELGAEGGELRRWRVPPAGPPTELGHPLALTGKPLALTTDAERGLLAVVYQDGSCEVWGEPPR